MAGPAEAPTLPAAEMARPGLIDEPHCRTLDRSPYTHRPGLPPDPRDRMSDDCIFCRIVRGDLPSDAVHETERVLAFRDLSPKAPTHILVIPKTHIASLSAADESHVQLLGELQRAAAEVARAEGIVQDGWRLITNIGPHGGQSVGHLHYHVLGGRQLGWPPG